MTAKNCTHEGWNETELHFLPTKSTTKIDIFPLEKISHHHPARQSCLGIIFEHSGNSLIYPSFPPRNSNFKQIIHRKNTAITVTSRCLRMRDPLCFRYCIKIHVQRDYNKHGQQVGVTNSRSNAGKRRDENNYKNLCLHMPL